MFSSNLCDLYLINLLTAMLFLFFITKARFMMQYIELDFTDNVVFQCMGFHNKGLSFNCYNIMPSYWTDFISNGHWVCGSSLQTAEYKLLRSCKTDYIYLKFACCKHDITYINPIPQKKLHQFYFYFFFNF